MERPPKRHSAKAPSKTTEKSSCSSSTSSSSALVSTTTSRKHLYYCRKGILSANTLAAYAVKVFLVE